VTLLAKGAGHRLGHLQLTGAGFAATGKLGDDPGKGLGDVRHLSDGTDSEPGAAVGVSAPAQLLMRATARPIRQVLNPSQAEVNALAFPAMAERSLPGAGASSTGRIFISYRRQETAYAAGWLFDRLADRFGAAKIFKDVTSIELGDDFVDVIAAAVGACDVLLALIGDQWLTVSDADGKPRIQNPTDFVRIEIEAALARNVRVVPILVEGASMPDVSQLPASMARLARRQALELSPSRFESDTERLLTVLEARLADAQASTPAASDTGTARPPRAVVVDEAVTAAPPFQSGKSSPAPPRRLRRPGILGGAAGAAVLVIMGIVITTTRPTPDTPVPPGTATSSLGVPSKCGSEILSSCSDLQVDAKYGPSLAGAGGTLLVALGENIDGEQKSALNVLKSSGTSVDEKHPLFSEQKQDYSPATPAIATNDTQAYIAWTGADPAGTLNVKIANLASTTSSNQYVDQKTVLSGFTSDVAPALGWHKGLLILAWKDRQGRVTVMSWQNGKKVENAAVVQGATSRTAPALAWQGDRMILAWVDMNGAAMSGQLPLDEGIGPTDVKLVNPHALGLKNLRGIALGSQGRGLVLAWLNDRAVMGLSISTDGSAFSEYLSMTADTETVPSVSSLGGRPVMGWVRTTDHKLRLAVVKDPPL